MKKRMIACMAIMMVAISCLTISWVARAEGPDSNDKSVSLDLRIGDKEYYGVKGNDYFEVPSLDVIKDITVLQQDGVDVEGMSSKWSMSTKYLDNQGRGVLEVQTNEEGKNYVSINLCSHYADCPGAKVDDFYVLNITLYVKSFKSTVSIYSADPVLDGDSFDFAPTYVDLTKTSKKKPAIVTDFFSTIYMNIVGVPGVNDVAFIKLVNDADKKFVTIGPEIVFKKPTKDITFQIKLNDGTVGYVTIQKVPDKTTIKSLKATKKSFTVKWGKKTKNVTGYQVRYRVKGASKWVTKTYKKSSVASATFKKLKSGKTYEVQVRTFFKRFDGNVYSAFSAKKTVKVE